MMIRYLLIAVVSYLLGSISFSILLSKMHYHDDVRSKGSGNAGATNMARSFGMEAGTLTLLGDMAKTILSLLLGVWLAGETGFAVAGISCLLGHCFPAFFHFKGGKGVSVGAAICLMLDWRVFLVGLTIFFLMFFLCRMVSACSITGALSLPVTALLFHISTPRLVVAVVTCVLVVWMHRSNIRRILSHTEPQFQPKR